MIALYYADVPIMFAEGIGKGPRNSFTYVLSELSPLLRPMCRVDHFHGTFPLEGRALISSVSTYHDVICPIADGVRIAYCPDCAKVLVV